MRNYLPRAKAPMCVCLPVRAISAIPYNKGPKNGHHKNQCPMGKILKGRFDFKCVVQFKQCNTN